MEAGGRTGVVAPFGSRSPTERTHTEPVSFAVIQQRAEQQRLGRNDVCLCGSGCKYKRCWGSAGRNS